MRDKDILKENSEPLHGLSGSESVEVRGLEPLMLAWKARVLANYTIPTYISSHTHIQIFQNQIILSVAVSELL